MFDIFGRKRREEERRRREEAARRSSLSAASSTDAVPVYSGYQHAPVSAPACHTSHHGDNCSYSDSGSSSCSDGGSSGGGGE